MVNRDPTLLLSFPEPWNKWPGILDQPAVVKYYQEFPQKAIEAGYPQHSATMRQAGIINREMVLSHPEFLADNSIRDPAKTFPNIFEEKAVLEYLSNHPEAAIRMGYVQKFPSVKDAIYSKVKQNPEILKGLSSPARDLPGVYNIPEVAQYYSQRTKSPASSERNSPHAGSPGENENTKPFTNQSPRNPADNKGKSPVDKGESSSQPLRSNGGAAPPDVAGKLNDPSVVQYFKDHPAEAIEKDLLLKVSDTRTAVLNAINSNPNVLKGLDRPWEKAPGLLDSPGAVKYYMANFGPELEKGLMVPDSKTRRAIYDMMDSKPELLQQIDQPWRTMPGILERDPIVKYYASQPKIAASKDYIRHSTKLQYTEPLFRYFFQNPSELNTEIISAYHDLDAQNMLWNRARLYIFQVGKFDNEYEVGHIFDGNPQISQYLRNKPDTVIDMVVDSGRFAPAAQRYVLNHRDLNISGAKNVAKIFPFITPTTFWRGIVDPLMLNAKDPAAVQRLTALYPDTFVQQFIHSAPNELAGRPKAVSLWKDYIRSDAALLTENYQALKKYSFLYIDNPALKAAGKSDPAALAAFKQTNTKLAKLGYFASNPSEALDGVRSLFRGIK